MNLPKSKLVKKQVKNKLFEAVKIDGELCDVHVSIRYDDKCGNGHNSFAITGDCYRAGRAKIDRNLLSCGCIHDIIAVAFPAIKPYLKWHLTGSDGPMHYVANSLYHAKATPTYDGDYWFFLENKLIKIVSATEKAAMINKYGGNAVFKFRINTMAKQADLQAAKDSAVWPEVESLAYFTEENLMNRLPSLMRAFKRDMITLGFEY